MDDKIIKELHKGSRQVYKKGDFIIRQGQPVNYVYYLSSGICIRNSFNSKGDEIIYDMRIADNSAHCLLGSLTLYYPQVIHATNFVAKTTCICYRIPSDNFLGILTTHPEVLHELLYLAMDRYCKLDKNFHSKQKGYIANRVCSFIMENVLEKDNRLWLNKSFTNSEISRYLGVHRVTIIKILKKLENDGLIRRSQEGLQILDAKQILAYAREEKILNYRDVSKH